MEDKANKMLDSAMAEAELTSGSTGEDLVDKYTSGTSGLAVDDELAAMKEKLGMA